jgi:hypothetical protein
MARKIVNGKAVVSAKELEASGLSLRDFLNKEQGLTRKAPEGTKFGERGTREDATGGKSTVDRQDAMLASSRKNAGQKGYDEGGDPIKRNTSKSEDTKSEAPKSEAPKLRARSLVDQGRGVQLYKDVDKEAVLNAGLGLASVFPAVAGTRLAYAAARPAIGAAARYFSKKDSPAASVADDIKDPSFNPEKMVDRSRSEPAFNPDKMVDRRSTTFPGRSEPKFNPDKMTGRDRPEPEFKKGGKVSSASSRGDGIAQRGKTKGRMC